MAERYTHGHIGTVLDDHSQRTAANSAAFLLSHLNPKQRLLDIGCGPGSITLDLAQHVGQVVGIDAAPVAIDRAREDAAARGVTNVTFRVADVYSLDYAADSFDVVYGHQLLQHLSRPVAALEETRRVLKPGGILAVRDADYGTMVHDPHDPLIDRCLELYHQLARGNGGEPDAGRRLGRWVAAAGFEDVTTTTSTWTYTTPAAIEGWRALWSNRVLKARMGRSVLEQGLADEAEIQEMAAAFDRWAGAPHPFFAFLHGEVLAGKPIER